MLDLQNNLETAKRIDLYGGLLTQSQQDVLKQYYFDNFSIVEIAQNKSISKQSVSDMLKRSIKQLQHFEEELRFSQKLDAIEALSGDITKDIILAILKN